MVDCRRVIGEGWIENAGLVYRFTKVFKFRVRLPLKIVNPIAGLNWRLDPCPLAPKKI